MALGQAVLLWLAAVLLAQPCLSLSYTLHHRIWPEAWTKRGTIQTDHAELSKRGQNPSATYEDLTGKNMPWESLKGYETWSEDFYQLAITSDASGKVDELTPITFAKVCQLATPGDEKLTIHISDDEGEVLSLGYEVLGLQASQLNSHGCPDVQTSVTEKSTLVDIRRPDEPLNPLPPPPPPTRQDGTPLAEGEQPPKEKSFVAKYWMYILPVVLLMLIPTEIADSNNEEAENGGGLEGNPFSSGVQKGASGGVRRR